MIRAATSVVVWPLGMASWPKSDPSKPSVMVCSSAETSNGKANGKVKAAAVDLLLVTGANGDWIENINESSLRSIDLIMFCGPWLGNEVPIRRAVIPSFNQVTWTNVSWISQLRASRKVHHWNQRLLLEQRGYCPCPGQSC